MSEQLPTKDDVRLYTLAEANALLPEVRDRVQALRDAVERLLFAREQVQDLERNWQDQLDEGTDGTREAYDHWRRELFTHQTSVDEQLLWFQEHGIEVKDPVLGLVDFYCERDNGELVYLCWQQGEAEVLAWHPLRGGFQGRRPVEEL